MNKLKIFLSIALILIIVIPFIISGIKNSKAKDNDELNYDPPKMEYSPGANSSTTVANIEYTYDTVYYTGEYGDPVYVPSSCRGAFLNSTQPYCVINANGVEKCGQKKQDISSKFGKSEHNEQLWFKSSNGESGYLILRKRDI